MKQYSRGFYLVCAVVFAGIAVSAMGCLGMGTTDGTIGFNIGDQPGWGPTGYDHADFYYMPDIDSYYSISEHQYIYREGPEWRHAASLPARYSGYDAYHSYKVVINEDKPYEKNTSHQAKYGSFKGVKDQPVIRDSRDSKYFVSKDHPEHDKWNKEQRH